MRPPARCMFSKRRPSERDEHSTMSQPISDRDYLSVPRPTSTDDSHPVGVSAAAKANAARLAIFRANLLYIASDLRQLASSAPAGRRAQMTALSVMVAALADR